MLLALLVLAWKELATGQVVVPTTGTDSGMSPTVCQLDIVGDYSNGTKPISQANLTCTGPPLLIAINRTGPLAAFAVQFQGVTIAKEGDPDGCVQETASCQCLLTVCAGVVMFNNTSITAVNLYDDTTFPSCGSDQPLRNGSA